MDQTDRDILNLIQSNLPITARPYLAVAEELGLSEDEVLTRVKALKEGGVIRRIGGNINSRKVGYASTLCAAQVGEEEFNSFVEAVNARPGVTHNYLRDDDDYNVWFTLIAPSPEDLAAELAAIEAETDIQVLSLPAIKTFKIAVDFEV